MKTPLIEIELSQFIKRDQTDHMSHKTTREASQAGSMSEAVNNKVRSDTDIHLGCTMYLRYKANSTILLRESCVNTLTHNSSAFLEDISFSCRANSSAHGEELIAFHLQ